MAICADNLSKYFSSISSGGNDSAIFVIANNNADLLSGPDSMGFHSETPQYVFHTIVAIISIKNKIKSIFKCFLWNLIFTAILN
tara:strand:+ start:300 stop:551 length:252 start_codon:yes stop_codon:yes gene_type:complete